MWISNQREYMTQTEKGLGQVPDSYSYLTYNRVGVWHLTQIYLWARILNTIHLKTRWQFRCYRKTKVTAEQEADTVKTCRLNLAGQISTKGSADTLKNWGLLPSCHTRELCTGPGLASWRNQKQNACFELGTLWVISGEEGKVISHARNCTEVLCTIWYTHHPKRGRQVPPNSSTIKSIVHSIK